MSFDITFNGTVLPIRVRSVGGRGAVYNEVTAVSIPNRDGAYYVKKRLPARAMPVEFALNTNGIEDIRTQIDALNAILIQGKQVEVTFSDEPGKTYFAFLDGEPDADEMFYLAKGTLPLVRQPYKYLAEATINSSADSLVVNNTGAENSNFVITTTFTGSATGFKVTDNDSGDFIRVIFSFVSTDILEIDFTKRKISINGIVQMTTLDLSSDWFNLEKGSSTLNLTAASPSSSVLKYKPRLV